MSPATIFSFLPKEVAELIEQFRREIFQRTHSGLEYKLRNYVTLHPILVPRYLYKIERLNIEQYNDYHSRID